MLGKGCIASLLPLGQPMSFEDVLSSQILEHPGQAVTAGEWGGIPPQQALLGHLMPDEFDFASYSLSLSAQT